MIEDVNKKWFDRKFNMELLTIYDKIQKEFFRHMKWATSIGLFDE